MTARHFVRRLRHTWTISATPTIAKAADHHGSSGSGRRSNGTAELPGWLGLAFVFLLRWAFASTAFVGS